MGSDEDPRRVTSSEPHRTAPGIRTVPLEGSPAAEVLAPVLHDLLNVLTAVGTMAHTAALQVEHDSPAADTIAELRDLVTHAMETPRELLEELDPTRSGRLSDLCALVREGFSLARNAAEGVELELELPEERVWVALAPAALERILLNLVVNARDATEQGGKVSVTVEHLPMAGRDAAALVVSDPGHGMSEAVLRRAFDPYFTTKEAPSHGVGLSTVEWLARQAGGEVRIESRPGRGTTVRVIFPLYGAPSGGRFRPRLPLV